MCLSKRIISSITCTLRWRAMLMDLLAFITDKPSNLKSSPALLKRIFRAEPDRKLKNTLLIVQAIVKYAENVVSEFPACRLR